MIELINKSFLDWLQDHHVVAEDAHKMGIRLVPQKIIDDMFGDRPAPGSRTGGAFIPYPGTNGKGVLEVFGHKGRFWVEIIPLETPQ